MYLCAFIVFKKEFGVLVFDEYKLPNGWGFMHTGLLSDRRVEFSCSS